MYIHYLIWLILNNHIIIEGVKNKEISPTEMFTPNVIKKEVVKKKKNLGMFISSKEWNGIEVHFTGKNEKIKNLDLRNV